MRHIKRALSAPNNDNAPLIADAMGVVALFALLIGALHLPILG